MNLTLEQGLALELKLNVTVEHTLAMEENLTTEGLEYFRYAIEGIGLVSCHFP